MPTRLPQEPSPAQTEERLALTRIRHQLARYSPRVLAESVELAHAAVALILRETSGEAEVLVIWRAEQPGDPWSGHLGFPGGRVEPGDVSLARSLSRMLPMSIIPFVCELVNPATQRLNGEVVKTRWIPLRYFLNRANRATMSHPGDPTQTVSCYPLEDRAIWGMSLAMIDELLLDVLSANP